MDKELKVARKDLVVLLKQIQVKMQNEVSNNTVSGTTIGGIVYGNVSNASSIYGTDKFSTPRGHGFAAEQANHLFDKITNADFFGQEKVRMVGEDIDPKTGRIVKNGAIIATSAFGISTVLAFATSVWNGDEFDIAIKTATYTGLKVGGTTFVTAVLSSQLSKAGLNSALVSSSEAIVSVMGPKASAVLVNAFRSGTNIYGAAAMKSAAKLLRGNAITGVASVVILSSVDIVNIFRGRISGKQLFKNVANTTTTVVSGTAGWVGGATVGATIGSAVPIIGTVIGGFAGGLIGSVAAGATSGKVSKVVLDAFIEDDAEAMTRIIEKVFQEMSVDYLLNQKEAENIVDSLKEELTGRTLKDMFASKEKEEFAKNLLTKHIESEVRNRKKILVPSEKEMQKSLRKVLEEMADEMYSNTKIMTT